MKEKTILSLSKHENETIENDEEMEKKEKEEGFHIIFKHHRFIH